MTALLKKYSQHLILTLSFLVILHFVFKPDSLSYYFRNTLGRALILLFVVIVTSLNSSVGIILALFLIAIYNSKVLEGFETDSTPTATPSPSTSPTSTTASTSASPSPTSSLKDTAIPPADKSTPTVITGTEVSDAKKKQEGFSNNRYSLSPASYGTERNVIIRGEHNIRPKASNSLMISKDRESLAGEPISNASGREGMCSSCAKY